MSSLLRSSFTVGFFILISRLLGFVRDVIFAAVLGAGPVADVFYVAFRLPNYFRELFAEGAFSATFIPQFTRMSAASGLATALVFAEQTLSVLLVVLVGFSVVMEFGMPWVVMGLAPGFTDDPDRFALTVHFTRMMFPYLTFLSMVALFGGILNSMGKFAPFSAAPIMMNICLITAMLTLPDFMPTPGHAATWGVIVAGVVQFLWLWGAARYYGIRLRLRKPHLSPEVKRLMKLILPAAMASGVLQMNLLVDNVLASFLQAGSVSYLYYADRLVQLPVGIVGTAMGTALLPLLSRQLQEGKPEVAIHNQNRAIELVLMLTLPAAVALMIIPHSILHVLFERGQFSAADSSNAAIALAALAFGLPAIVLTRVLNPGFFARQDTVTPFRIGLVVVTMNLIADVVLMQIFSYAGIALATAVAAWTNALLLGTILWRRGHFHLQATVRKRLARILLAALLMGGGLYVAQPYITPLAVSGLFLKILHLGIMIGGGAALYFTLLFLVGAVDRQEIASILKRLKKKDI